MNAIVFSAVWGVLLLFAGIGVSDKRVIRWTAIVGMMGLLLVNWLQLHGVTMINYPGAGLFRFEAYNLLFTSVMYGCTLIYFLLFSKEIEKVGVHVAEYFALIFFICCGVAIVSTYDSLLLLFLGIEIISIPLYILAGSDKRNLKSNEASLKYLLMGAFSTGLMLMGIALLYGAKGDFSLAAMATGNQKVSSLALAGILLMLFSMSFKVSAAPFHFWTPDVYDGSPSVFTAFMATIVKAAAFIAFFHLFQDAFGSVQPSWQLIAGLITAATLLVGNFTAVFQQSLKRLLAYSSIAQAGFMMLALVALNGRAKEGLLFYATAYTLSSLGVFAVMMTLKDFSLEGINGLGNKKPVLAAVMTLFLFSLAGIPGTAGFLAKFLLITAVLQTGQLFWLVILAVLTAAISVFYYFRVVQSMYFKSGDPQLQEVSRERIVLLVLLSLLIILLGVSPQLLLDQLYILF